MEHPRESTIAAPKAARAVRGKNGRHNRLSADVTEARFCAIRADSAVLGAAYSSFRFNRLRLGSCKELCPQPDVPGADA
jgi:hypothetical protein